MTALAERIAACERRWSIQVEAPFADLSYNWTAPAGDVVLKLGRVDDAELASEVVALHAWAGQGAVRLIDVDVGLGALLLERLRPGTNLVAVDDERATSIAIDIGAQLHAMTPPVALPSLAEWTDGIARAHAASLATDGGSVAGFPSAMIDRVVGLRNDLLASSSQPVLLHGDLHHYNILAAERALYLAIDPKGVAGDPAYEPSVFLYNPFDREVDARTVARRVDQFAEVFDRERLLGWAFVQAVLSAWWSFEDHGREDAGMRAFVETLPK